MTTTIGGTPREPRPSRAASRTTDDGPALPGRSGRRRHLEVVGFVAVWVAAGYLLPVDSNGYLLLGIPLTLAFQTLVRRRPVRELVAANLSWAVLDRRGVALALLLAAVPGYLAVQALPTRDWALVGWYLAATVGAVCAAAAVRAGSLAGALRSAALPIAVGSAGMAVVYSTIHLATGAPLPVGGAVEAFVRYTALYLPAAFLLEEVTFRGALDAHVHDGEGRGTWTSAVVVSALWGLWHLPVTHGLPFPLQVAELVVVHVALGVPLALAWRSTRNLAGPALAHAVNDAVRNAFMLGL